MTARGRHAAVAGVALLIATACADYVGDDLRRGEAQLRPGPSIELDATSTTTTIASDPVDPRSLAVGACADDVPVDADDDTDVGPGDDGATTQPGTVDPLLAGAPVLPRSCAQEHRYEVVAVEPLAAPDAEWPGPEALEEVADRLCTARFEAYVGRPWSETTLDHLALTPDEAAWGAGDRQVTCVVFDLGLAPLEGSLSSGR